MAIEIETTVINVTISTGGDQEIQVTIPQSFGVIKTELTDPQDGDELYYDDVNEVWKNRRGRVILTQAEYDLLTPDSDVLYYITD